MTNTQLSVGMARWRNARTGAFLLGLTLGLAVAFGPAQAGKVGVAAAVNPDAFSSLSGTPNKQLNIGKSIFYNERIKTTTNGLVQVLLVDGSTFTVGPNSDLVINKFVYDPKKKTGQIVATFSKGTMRFIGGKLSKNAGGVTVNTPSGALAIRGGMFQGNASRGIYSFLYGHSLTFRGKNGQTQTIFEPGYTLDLSRGSANVRPTTAADTNSFMQALASGGRSQGSGDNGGSDNPGGGGGGGALQAANALQAGASTAISDANTIIVQTEILTQLANLEILKNPDSAPPASTPDTGPTPEPVIKNGGTFTGYSSGFIQHGEDGLGEPEFLVGGTSRVVLDPETNTVSGDIEVTQINRLILPKTTTFNLGFRGAGDNAYIDDNTFLALGDDGSTSVVRNELVTRWVPEQKWVSVKKWVQTGRFPWQGKWISVDKLITVNKLVTENVTTNIEPVSHTGSFASIPNAPLCSDCDFLKYGFWGSDITYGDNTDKMGGWWIASNAPVSESDLPTQGGANYEGSAIGTLATRAGPGVWNQGVATGDLAMGWDFGKRKGDLQISNFGNSELGYKTFGGPISAPGSSPANFGGIITGRNGTIGGGLASGSFVGPRGGQAPAGVMGNFGIGANHWKANGVFGGSVVPNPR